MDGRAGQNEYLDRPNHDPRETNHDQNQMKALDIAAEILLGIGATLLFVAFVREFFTFAP
jgi:hypothetical protein